jgi:NDP-sugar pyrophosphorylase family protein
MGIMKAIIQAGGMGTRLRPVTYEIPKPLVPVNKKPIINHLIGLFHRYGFSDIAVIANKNHQDDFYRWGKAWRDDLPTKEVSIFYEETPRGTFGGLEPLREWVGSEPFILSWSDELKDFDLDALAQIHRQSGGVATIALAQVENARDYGVPILDGTRVTEFLEKPEHPPSHFINAGLFMVNPEIFEWADWSQQTIMIEKDIFPKLAAEGRLHAFRDETARWYDCGNLERWERAMKEW